MALQIKTTMNEIKIIMAFERIFGGEYSVREKYFYVILRSLCLSRKSEDGWVFLSDAPKQQLWDGFGSYGLSPRVCKSSRRKLKRDGLLECRYIHGAKGHRVGTAYRLLDERFANDPKAIHAAIIGGLERRVIHSVVKPMESSLVEA